MLGKWSVPCTAPVSTQLLGSIFTSDKSNQKNRVLLCAGATQSSLFSLDRVQKHVCRLMDDEVFSATTPISLDYGYNLLLVLLF